MTQWSKDMFQAKLAKVEETLKEFKESLESANTGLLSDLEELDSGELFSAVEELNDYNTDYYNDVSTDWEDEDDIPSNEDEDPTPTDEDIQANQ